MNSPTPETGAITRSWHKEKKSMVAGEQQGIPCGYNEVVLRPGERENVSHDPEGWGCLRRGTWVTCFERRKRKRHPLNHAAPSLPHSTRYMQPDRSQAGWSPAGEPGDRGPTLKSAIQGSNILAI